MRTYDEVRDLIEQTLEDTSNAIWIATELDALILLALTKISFYRPREVKLTMTTAASKKLTLSAENKRKLLWINELEYKVDEDPEQFRNWIQRGDSVVMGISATPAASETVYLYVAKQHTLYTMGTDDIEGAIDGTKAIGSTSLVLKLLGTGAINEDTTLTIAGDSTEYTVIANATITANAATVSIVPALVAEAADDAVVTLADPSITSTLDVELEECLVDLVAGQASINKARTYMNKVNVGSSNRAPAELESWGMNKLALVMQRLRAMKKIRVSQIYPQG